MQKIPKIIHYCWVGGNPKPESVLYCIESWKRFCPDYEIREWNESNYDFSKNKYMKQAYDTKKWGFVPDYARLDIVYTYGGIYLDTDVEMIRNFDELLNQDGFFGFEDTGEGTYFIACGLGFGASKHNPLIKRLRDYYDNISFVNHDGSLNLLPAPQHNIDVFVEYGVIMDNTIQKIQNNVFYPSEYFCPKIFKTGKMKITKRTFSIHHFSASWLDDVIRKEILHNQKICLRYGDIVGKKYLFIESLLHKYGFFGSIKKVLIYIYEKLYLYYPIIIGLIKKFFRKSINNDEIVLIDTALGTKNMGDLIIMEYCTKYLDHIFELQDIVHISSHKEPSNMELDEIQRNRKILCGTNALSCNMSRYRLWKLPKKIDKFYNITLMGVGFDSYNIKPDIYTKLLLKLILSKKGFHSVRDSFSEQALKTMGINNVLNTGCPTMWGLTSEHCKSIPTRKSTNVICTLTDYSKDISNDIIMLNILLESYKKVYLWLQGQGDLEYIQQLGYDDKVILISSDLKAYDNILEQSDLDYVGTRLHAGIRALNKGHRSLIVSIDNRAECIHNDTGLPIIHRYEIKSNLKNILYDDIKTDIQMPWDNITQWMKQFRK